MIIIRVEVVLGAHNITSDETTQIRISGESVIIHENFSYRDYQNDIALIKLSEPAPLNEYIDLIPLPTRADADNNYFDETVTSVGWGLSADVVDHQPTKDDLSPLLRYVLVSVLSISECGDYYNDYDNDVLYVTEKNVCTSGYKNKGTCNGDSGGPLIYNGTQVGLVSIGTDLCEICSPSIFTNVAKHLDWIEEHSDVVIS
ncbi:hypothetical protein NQ314_002681 [Rhamnusium bicolor]|uniref:Peptidase S1 domain-containing protein n=1 Tax=Rhamnusium bicolor TaxID=1586634 RepID=A0AAV8ZQP2_9CUCU|nr:hypothetical protein NQ314_002681 [Rhamnusium bicolor]